MINGHIHTAPEPDPPSSTDIHDAAAFLIRVLAVVLLISAAPLQVALWRWVL